jgi:hypothetical protein
MQSSAGIYFTETENGITLAVKPNWEGAEKFTFFDEIDLEQFHT